MSKREIVNLLELNGVDLGKLTEIVIKRAAEENRPQWDVLKEELLKIAQGQTDQSKAQEHLIKTSNNIITSNGGNSNGRKKNV